MIQFFPSQNDPIYYIKWGLLKLNRYALYLFFSMLNISKQENKNFENPNHFVFFHIVITRRMRENPSFAKAQLLMTRSGEVMKPLSVGL